MTPWSLTLVEFLQQQSIGPRESHILNAGIHVAIFKIKREILSPVGFGFVFRSYLEVVDWPTVTWKGLVSTPILFI